MIFFPKKFKEARERRGMTRKDLAEKLDVAESSVLNWEHGNHAPRIAMIHRIAEFFRCSEEEFADFEPGEYIPKRLTANELAARGAIAPGVQLAPAEMIEAFRQAVLREIMLSDKLDPASKEAAYKIIVNYKMPPVEVKQ